MSSFLTQRQWKYMGDLNFNGIKPLLEEGIYYFPIHRTVYLLYF